MVIPSLTMPQSNRRKQAYLDAMDIDVWHLRESEPAGGILQEMTPGLKLGPGNGGILLICATDAESASRLANDINRALVSNPVWAWPDTDPAAMKLSNAVAEHLFTTVAFFGAAVAEQFFEGELPAMLNSSRLVLLPAIQDLQIRAEARQALWLSLCRSKLVDGAN